MGNSAELSFIASRNHKAFLGCILHYKRVKLSQGNQVEDEY